MKYNPKVVSIKRSAAYVHHRALKNMRDNNPVDALELMRRAVEHSPDNREYKLDLAEFYCEMGYHEQSNRILLDMIAGGSAPAECYYGLALNRFGRNELEAARRALMIYQKRAGDDEYLADAEGLTAEIEYMSAMKRPLDRRLGRAARSAAHACDALGRGETERAIRLFEGSLARNANQPEMRAVYAMALQMARRMDEAAAQARQTISDEAAGARALCIAAQVLQSADCGAEAQRAIRRAAELKPEDENLRLLIYSLGEMGLHAEAAEAARLALRDAPHDKALLHARAVALKLSGAADETLLPFWQRILRIDPEDTVARYYLETAQKGALDQIELEYMYEVPAEEFVRRVEVLAEPLTQGLGNAAARCQADAQYRGLLIWAAGSNDLDCARAAMMVLASVDDPASESALRELLYRGSVQHAAKLYATFFLSLRGADMRRFLPPDAEAGEGMLPEAGDMLEKLPVGERQLIRFAAEVLEQEYGFCAQNGLAAMWRVYRDSCRGCDSLVCTQEAAAALAWNYLLGHGKKPRPEELARQFDCAQRRMVFYARRMAAVLEVYTEEDRREDH